MSYGPLDGQETHVACLFCQRGLKEVPWELRQQVHKKKRLLMSARVYSAQNVYLLHIHIHLAGQVGL
jgi:hypothetical protein